MRPVTFLCSCGSSARATSAPPGVAVELVDRLRSEHLADGHHEVDAREFARIRAGQRRQENKEIADAAR